MQPKLRPKSTKTVSGRRMYNRVVIPDRREDIARLVMRSQGSPKESQTFATRQSSDKQIQYEALTPKQMEANFHTAGDTSNGKNQDGHENIIKSQSSMRKNNNQKSQLTQQQMMLQNVTTTLISTTSAEDGDEQHKKPRYTESQEIYQDGQESKQGRILPFVRNSNGKMLKNGINEAISVRAKSKGSAIGAAMGEVILNANDLAVEYGSGQMVPLNYVSKPRQQLSVAQIKRPFKQQRTAITKSSILRVKRDLEQADEQLIREQNASIQSGQIPSMYTRYDGGGIIQYICQENQEPIDYGMNLGTQEQLLQDFKSQTYNLFKPEPSSGSKNAANIYQRLVLSKRAKHVSAHQQHHCGSPLDHVKSFDGIAENSQDKLMTTQQSEGVHYISALMQRPQDARYPPENRFVQERSSGTGGGGQTRMTIKSDTQMDPIFAKESSLANNSGNVSKLSPIKKINSSNEMKQVDVSFPRGRTPSLAFNPRHAAKMQQLSTPVKQTVPIMSKINSQDQFMKENAKNNGNINPNVKLSVPGPSTMIFGTDRELINKDLEMVEASSNIIQKHSLKSPINSLMIQAHPVMRNSQPFSTTNNRSIKSPANRFAAADALIPNKNIRSSRLPYTATRYSQRPEPVKIEEKAAKQQKQTSIKQEKVTVKVDGENIEIHDSPASPKDKHSSLENLKHTDTLEQNELKLLINSTIEHMKVEEDGQNGNIMSNAHLIEVDFQDNAENQTNNNDTMLRNNQEETDNPLNTKPNSPIPTTHKKDEGILLQTELLIKEEDNRQVMEQQQSTIQSFCSKSMIDVVTSNQIMRDASTQQKPDDLVTSLEQAVHPFLASVDPSSLQSGKHDELQSLTEEMSHLNHRFDVSHRNNNTNTNNNFRAEVELKVEGNRDNLKRSLKEIMVPTKPKIEKTEIKKETKMSTGLGLEHVKNNILQNFNQFKQLLSLRRQSNNEEEIRQRIGANSFTIMENNEVKTLESCDVSQPAIEYTLQGQEGEADGDKSPVYAQAMETQQSALETNSTPLIQQKDGVSDLTAALVQFKQAFMESKIGEADSQKDQWQVEKGVTNLEKEDVNIKVQEYNQHQFSQPSVMIKRPVKGARTLSNQRPLAACVPNHLTSVKYRQKQYASRVQLRSKTNQQVQAARQRQPSEFSDQQLKSSYDSIVLKMQNKQSIMSHIIKQQQNNNQNILVDASNPQIETDALIIKKLNSGRVSHMNRSEGRMSAPSQISCDNTANNSQTRLHRNTLNEPILKQQPNVSTAPQRLTLIQQYKRKSSNDMGTNPMDPIIALALTPKDDDINESVMLIDTALKHTVMNTSPDNQISNIGQTTLLNETTNFKQQYYTDIDEIIDNQQKSEQNQENNKQEGTTSSLLKRRILANNFHEQKRSNDTIICPKEEKLNGKVLTIQTPAGNEVIKVNKLQITKNKAQIHVMTKRKRKIEAEPTNFVQVITEQTQDDRENRVIAVKAEPQRQNQANVRYSNRPVSSIPGSKTLQFNKLPSHLQQKYFDLFRPRELQDMLVSAAQTTSPVSKNGAMNSFSMSSTIEPIGKNLTKVAKLMNKKQRAISQPNATINSTNTHQNITKNRRKVLMDQSHLSSLLKNVNFFKAEKHLLNQKGLKFNRLPKATSMQTGKSQSKQTILLEDTPAQNNSSITRIMVMGTSGAGGAAE